MDNVSLNQEERDLLVEVLDSYLSDLRMEIANTDHSEFKIALKSKRKALDLLFAKIKGH
ncbi:MAG TPA: hypothetical protein VLV83_12170 [Acidobacteriota bacterium]|nr:hypothetical protein [Acidobacteriota bacterium]